MSNNALKHYNGPCARACLFVSFRLNAYFYDRVSYGIFGALRTNEKSEGKDQMELFYYLCAVRVFETNAEWFTGKKRSVNINS